MAQRIDRACTQGKSVEERETLRSLFEADPSPSLYRGAASPPCRNEATAHERGARRLPSLPGMVPGPCTTGPTGCRVRSRAVQLRSRTSCRSPATRAWWARARPRCRSLPFRIGPIMSTIEKAIHKSAGDSADKAACSALAEAGFGRNAASGKPVGGCQRPAPASTKSSRGFLRAAQTALQAQSVASFFHASCRAKRLAVVGESGLWQVHTGAAWCHVD